MKWVVVGTAGHIDHGKSALVQALTGTDPDRLKEEKARGITIDLGFAHLTLGDIHFAFVDVPGHERFVKNMLAGVGGIDLVVLVVAADDGVMPQTREHFDICRLLDVPAGVVALTKADLVDADTLELARLEVLDLVAGSFLAPSPIVPVSSRTGQGLEQFRASLVAAAAATRDRTADGVTRLPIDRAFSMKGFGTIVTGTLVSGRVGTDDELRVAPGERRVTVRGVQVHGTRREEAVAGQRTAVNVSGAEVEDLERGQSLVSPGAFEPTRVADAVVETLSSAKPLKHGARIRFHQGTAEILGRVALIGPPRDASGADERPRPSERGWVPASREERVGRRAHTQVRPGVAPGSRAFIRLRLERPAVLTRGDRYILRAYSPPLTIAGGRILDPQPPRTGTRRDAALERCRRLDVRPAGSVESQLAAAAMMIADAGMAGLPITALVSRAAIVPPAIDVRIEALVEARQAVRAGDVLVAPDVLERLKASIVELLGQHHRDHPLSEGVGREEARVRLFGRGHAAVFERALDELGKAGTVVARDRLALTTHRLVLSPEEERAREAIERMLREAGLKPPDVAALASGVGVPAGVVDRVVKLLQRQKRLVKIDTLLFHDEALKQLKESVVAMKMAAGVDAKIDVATFKERFGVTRKFAIPLLEYLDRERVTRRVGDVRIIT
jgi:selenocysteine-specific elongation factor